MICCGSFVSAQIGGLLSGGRGPGRALLNTSFFGNGLYEMLNYFKTCGAWSSSAGYAFPAALDSNGFPVGTITQDITCATRIPSTYTGDWILDWAGTLSTLPTAGLKWGLNNVTITSGGAFVTSSSNGLFVGGTNGRVQFKMTGTLPSNPTLRLLSTGAFSGLTQIRLYRADQEANVLAGETINPEFSATINEINPRIVRFLHWQEVNDSNQAAWGVRNPATNFQYAQRWVPSKWAGVTSGTDTYTVGNAPDSDPSAYVANETLQVQFSNAMTSTGTFFTGSISGTTLTVSAVASGTLAVGQTVRAFGTYPGTKIVSLGSGSGGTGTYNISISQTLTSSSFIGSITPTINRNSLGAKPILDTSAQPLNTGAIAANQLATLVYDAVLDAFTYKSGGVYLFVPVDEQLNLCNVVRRDCWFTIPAFMDDASISAMIAYISANLWSGANAYLEYSNEVWNFGFTQTQWIAQHGVVLGFVAGSNRQVHDPFALRNRQIEQIALTAWSPRAQSQLKMAITSQFLGSNLTELQLYRFNGTDLTLDSQGKYTTVPGDIVTNYSVAGQRPIDFYPYTVLSHAPYYNGGEIRGIDSSYTNVMTGAVAAVDNYLSGDASRIATAFAFVNTDSRQGLKNGVLGTQTLLNYATNTTPPWAVLIASYGLPVVAYEGGYEAVAPSASRLTALGLTTSEFCADAACLSAGFASLLAAFKQTDTFRQLVNDQWVQWTSAMSTPAMPGWYEMGNSGQWSLISGNLYSLRYQNFNANQNFNAGLP